MVKCIECNGIAKLVSGDIVYPHRKDMHKKWFYMCSCGAYVGCHGFGVKPLGYACSEMTRKKRSMAHILFDRLWRSGLMTRSSAYTEMAKNMGIKKSLCHIAMFNSSQCDMVCDFSISIMDVK